MTWHIFCLFFILRSSIAGAYSIGFHRTMDLASRVEPQTPGSLMLHNKADVSYYADIVVGDQTFRVLVDTGSSDLWISGSVSKSTPTGLNASISYAADSVAGSIKRATVQFAGQYVNDQAFLEIQPTEKYPPGYGILGLGPGSESYITQKLPLGSEETLLNRIFSKTPNTENYFTLLLGRNKDPTTFFQGSITVGEVIPQYAAILDEPRLPVTLVVKSDYVDQHLQVLLDADGIIGPDGEPIPIVSSVAQTVDKRQATVVFDSGFTFPQFPREIVDQIYGRFVGAEYRDVPGFGGVYVLPCEQEVNITLKFAGKPYPIHPLDMTMEPTSVNLSAVRTRNGELGCIGTFQPFTYLRGREPSYDIVLGMSFLRNVYSFFDCGSYKRNVTTSEQPYIHLLSITDPAEAHSDFVTVRLGGIDTTGNRRVQPRNQGLSKSNTVYYAVAGVIGGLVLASIGVFFVWRSRRRRYV